MRDAPAQQIRECVCPKHGMKFIIIKVSPPRKQEYGWGGSGARGNGLSPIIIPLDLIFHHMKEREEGKIIEHNISS